jgi:hypothetical protein
LDGGEDDEDVVQDPEDGEENERLDGEANLRGESRSQVQLGNKDSAATALEMSIDIGKLTVSLPWRRVPGFVAFYQPQELAAGAGGPGEMQEHAEHCDIRESRI